MPLHPPCHCHPPMKPEPFTPTFKVIPSPDWTAWIRARLAEKGALLTFSFASEFPDRGSVTNVYLALDTGVMYRWDGSQYQVLVDPESADDVLTYADRAAFPETGSLGKLYVAVDDGNLYVWNGVAYLELLGGKADKCVPETVGNFAGLDENGNITDSGKKPADYYTKEETDNAIDTLAAYYITYNQAGAAFPTKAALMNATTYYSGGVVRTPTRNDYAVVLADETHGGAEYRYIYSVPDGGTSGQWEAQYPIETNDYAALANKPQINGVALSGNKTGDAVGLVDKAGATMTGPLTVPSLTVGSRSNGGIVGQDSIATGSNVTASRPSSHAEGDSTTASEEGAHAEGNSTTASGLYAHAEGSLTTASEQNAHAEGTRTTASNSSAHAEGTGTTASGNSSHAEGKNTIAQNTAEHAQGVNNASHTGNTPAENTLYSIGVGTPNARQNAVEVMQDGKVFVKGLGNYEGTNPTASGVLDLAAAIYAIVQQIAPAWESGTAYLANKIVSYNGVFYQNTSGSTITSTTPPDTDTTRWTTKKVSELFLPLTGGEITGELRIYGDTPFLQVGQGSTDDHVAMLWRDHLSLSDGANLPNSIMYGLNTIVKSLSSGSRFALTLPNADGTLALLSNIYAAVQQIAPAWVNGRTYAPYALCTYNGIVYCNENGGTFVSDIPPNGDTNWRAKKVSELFLPLTGGTMSGDIEFPNRQGINFSGVTVQHLGYGAFRFQVGDYTTYLAISRSRYTTNFIAFTSNIAPNYSTSETYTLDSLCCYNEKLYRCTTAITTAEEWTAAHWTEATVEDVLAAIRSALDSKAPLASPAFTGTPTAPTAPAGTNTTQVATTAFVKAAVDAVDVSGQITGKLDSTSAAPAFDTTATYAVDEHVTYLGKLYRCTTAVTTAGAWTGSTNWTLDDMTTPDATLDVTAAKQLRVVAVDGTVLWAQGYDLATTSSVTLSNEAVNKYDFAVNATDAVPLTLPTPLSGKVGDFVLDVTNPALDATATGWAPAFDATANYAVGDEVSYDSKQWRCTVAVETAGEWTGSTNWEEAIPYFTLSGLGTIFNVVVPVNENLADMLTFAPGDMAELYFTQTSFTVGGLPAWKIVRQDVEAAV